jgi:hypothetical protein
VPQPGYWKGGVGNLKSSNNDMDGLPLPAAHSTSDLQQLGGIMPNRPKHKNRLIITKFGDIVGFASIKK